MRKTIILSALVLSNLLLGGCGKVDNNTGTTQQKLQENVVEKSGTIKAKAGDEYLLSTEDGIVNITSTKVNLDNYMKKQVTVKGMFSGSTLYVDEIK